MGTIKELKVSTENLPTQNAGEGEGTWPCHHCWTLVFPSGSSCVCLCCSSVVPLLWFCCGACPSSLSLGAVMIMLLIVLLSPVFVVPSSPVFVILSSPVSPVSSLVPVVLPWLLSSLSWSSRFLHWSHSLAFIISLSPASLLLLLLLLSLLSLLSLLLLLLSPLSSSAFLVLGLALVLVVITVPLF